MIADGICKKVLSVCVLAAAVWLMFFNLGNYALWDDEATTALFAQTVWKTGDTSALTGGNIIAYNGGIELKEFKNRFIPPLPFYMAAPFVGVAPGSALAARMPFAICGLLAFIVVLFWLKRSSAVLSSWVLITFGFLCNVSFLLYVRQCRYYAPVILFSMLIAYIYYFRGSNKRSIVGLILCSGLLLSANYLCYAGVMTCLAVDYLIWGRKNKSFSLKMILLFLGSQVFLVAALLSVYNPLGVDVWGVAKLPWWKEKSSLFFWNWRDLNNCEMGIGLFILAAPVIAYYTKKKELLQCFTALVTYVFVISILSPQPLNLLSVAFVRYLIPLIPLCILLNVLCIKSIMKISKWLAYIIAVFAFGTNVFHGGPLSGIDNKTVFSYVIAKGSFRSTIYEYVGELIDPPRTAYGETAEWINQNIEDGQSVWVTPGYARYPLMFHAPAPIYAWQFNPEQQEQFKDLPKIHFKGEELPEYIIAFGIYAHQAHQIVQNYGTQGIRYEGVEQIPLYWYDLIRPELFWHSFKPVTEYVKETEEVFIYKLVGQMSYE